MADEIIASRTTMFTDESSGGPCCQCSTQPKQLRAPNVIKCNQYQPNVPRTRQVSLNSNDSGVNSVGSLEPIAENYDHQGADEIKGRESQVCLIPKEEQNGHATRIPNGDVRENCNSNCRCAHFPQRTNSELMIQHRYPVNPREDLNIPHKYERVRNNSGNFRDSDEVIYMKDAGNRYSRGYEEYGGTPMVSAAAQQIRSEDVLKKVSKKLRRKKISQKVWLSIVALAVVLIFAVVAFLLIKNEAWMKQMEKKIQELEEELDEKSPSAFASPQKWTTPVKQTDSARPFAHFTLRNERNIQVNSWKYRVLQWNPVTSNYEDGGKKSLEYDSTKRSLIVREAGTYFVYNQIYIYRHVSESTRLRNTMGNHTLFHAIFNRPFNFPSNKEPVKISESTVSNCWNQNANTQIHTSYQGTIVNLQENDELLVALQEYDSAVDTLDPKSTFFGAFKL